MPDKTLYQEQRTSINEIEKYNRSLGDETSYVERYKKKNMKQDSKDYLHKDTRSDVEFPPVAGLTFPSVKGAEGTTLFPYQSIVTFDELGSLQDGLLIKFNRAKLVNLSTLH